MIREFEYCPRINPVGDITTRTRELQLGDGYTQRSGDGLNEEDQSWPLSFVGELDYITQIRQFLREHKGYKAFQWRNPMGELGLYCCQKQQVKASGKNAAGKPMFELSATFIIAYHP
ncbi:phage tail protein [Yersinia enterocolitica]|uniref:Phage minor tail protein n=1 Tax=Yersinia frederiksenii TaxID=29484 RepID=A0AAI9ENY1_YERFR|nr:MULTISPECIES: phage tail protein [Yersinia]MDN0125558.1 phage tail protein [Yersinia massiliensis]PHZ21501.1 phage tail protein [Yersinia massiliensis]CFQ98129.1 phage minor tail protein [Yersinia frederiksenii]CQI99362.1 phage minor tail protein [Yersinia frederiksenii]